MFRMSTVNLLSLSFTLSKNGNKILKTVELILHRWLGILIWNTLWASHPGQVIPTSLSKTLIEGKAPWFESVYYLFGQETRDKSSLLWLKKTLWASHPGQEIPTSLSEALITGKAPWSGNRISAAVRNCVTLFWQSTRTSHLWVVAILRMLIVNIFRDWSICILSFEPWKQIFTPKCQ